MMDSLILKIACLVVKGVCQLIMLIATSGKAW